MPTEDLSTITQRLRESHSAMSKDSGADEEATTFRATLEMASERAVQIAVNASIGDDEDMGSVAALTLAMLQVVASDSIDTGELPRAAHICRICGAVAERIPDPRLRCPDHCRALFNIVIKNLQYRKNSLEQGEDVDGEDLDAWCPPLMVFFCRNLMLLKKYRDTLPSEAKLLVDELPKSMLREFMKQLIDETLLCAFVENEAKPLITFAQRVTFTGLASNFELAQWAVAPEGIMPSNVQDIGPNIQMDCWTALYFNDGWNYSSDTHRIWHEGIPDDIAPLNGERVVLFHASEMGGSLFYNEVMFPYIQMKATPKGPPLDDAELEKLAQQIQDTDKEDVIKALKHQQKRGGDDDSLQSCIDQLQSIEE